MPCKIAEVKETGSEVEVAAKVEAAKPALVPPTPASPTPAKPAVDVDSVKERVLALVAEKTGYPVDMLDLDLDLEADLGIDTVKQAEVMATIREAYGIVRDDTVKLRDFPTLARVIQFVHDRKPGLRATQSAAGARSDVRPNLRREANN